MKLLWVVLVYGRSNTPKERKVGRRFVSTSIMVGVTMVYALAPSMLVLATTNMQSLTKN